MSGGNCRISQLRLFNFRSYAECSVEFGPGLNVIAGRNAQGKTNLLEGLATLLLTRSPRAPTLGELIRWEETECLVQARVNRPPGPVDLEVRLQRETPAARVTRNTLVNGKAQTARSVLGICPVVIFWPEDLDLVKGGPEGRRRRLDVLHSQIDPRAAADLVRYRRVVEQRNALLRQLREQRGSLVTLSSFDHELVEIGARIQHGRARLVANLSAPAEAALRSISTGSETLALHYRPDGLTDPNALAATATLADAEAALATRLAQRRADELLRAVSLAGPHRDDVELVLDGRPARTTASQGQHRSIVLALTLAEVAHIRATLGVGPVLLLDDVLSELDATRREALLEFVARNQQLQVLVTTAEPASLDPSGHRDEHRLMVEDGGVRVVQPAGR